MGFFCIIRNLNHLAATIKGSTSSPSNALNTFDISPSPRVNATAETAHRPCHTINTNQGSQIHSARHHSNRPRLYSRARESMAASTGGRQAQGKETAQKGSGETINALHKSPIPSFSSFCLLISFLRAISNPINFSLWSITARFLASCSSIFLSKF